jgi:hypothetical protein
VTFTAVEKKGFLTAQQTSEFFCQVIFMAASLFQPLFDNKKETHFVSQGPNRYVVFVAALPLLIDEQGFTMALMPWASTAAGSDGRQRLVYPSFHQLRVSCLPAPPLLPDKTTEPPPYPRVNEISERGKSPVRQ